MTYDTFNYKNLGGYLYFAQLKIDDQNLSLQIVALIHYGIDKLFHEKLTSAKKRPIRIRRND